MPLRDVEVSGIRGIRKKLIFSLRDQSLLLHGDNGTGKSSFERALRWALLGEDEPTDDAAFSTDESYRRHVEVLPDDAYATVSFSDSSEITVHRGRVDYQGKGQAIRNACVAARPFLRRSELLSVLTDLPGKRFSYFEGFLGLQRVDAAIEDLGNKKSALQNRVTVLEGRMNAGLEPLRSLLPARFGRVDSLDQLLKSVESWALELGISATSLTQRREELAVRLGVLKSGDAVSFPSRIEEATETVRKSSATVSALQTPLNRIVAQHRQLREKLTDAKDAELLEHALSHFKTKVGTTCPVCGQEVQWGDTADSLRNRVTALRQYAELGEELLTKLRELLSATVSLRGALGAGSSIAKSVSYSVPERFAVSPSVQSLVAANDVPQLGKEVDALGVGESLEQLAEAIAQALVGLTDLSGAVPNVQQLPDLQTASALHDQLAVAQPAIELLSLERSDL